eukprot:3125882-Amphidinium_carterae.1
MGSLLHDSLYSFAKFIRIVAERVHEHCVPLLGRGFGETAKYTAASRYANMQHVRVLSTH